MWKIRRKIYSRQYHDSKKNNISNQRVKFISFPRVLENAMIIVHVRKYNKLLRRIFITQRKRTKSKVLTCVAEYYFFPHRFIWFEYVRDVEIRHCDVTTSFNKFCPADISCSLFQMQMKRGRRAAWSSSCYVCISLHLQSYTYGMYVCTYIRVSEASWIRINRGRLLEHSSACSRAYSGLSLYNTLHIA